MWRSGGGGSLSLGDDEEDLVRWGDETRSPSLGAMNPPASARRQAAMGPKHADNGRAHNPRPAREDFGGRRGGRGRSEDYDHEGDEEDEGDLELHDVSFLGDTIRPGPASARISAGWAARGPTVGSGNRPVRVVPGLSHGSASPVRPAGDLAAAADHGRHGRGASRLTLEIPAAGGGSEPPVSEGPSPSQVGPDSPLQALDGESQFLAPTGRWVAETGSGRAGGGGGGAGGGVPGPVLSRQELPDTSRPVADATDNELFRRRSRDGHLSATAAGSAAGSAGEALSTAVRARPPSPNRNAAATVAVGDVTHSLRSSSAHAVRRDLSQELATMQQRHDAERREWERHNSELEERLEMVTEAARQAVERAGRERGRTRSCASCTATLEMLAEAEDRLDSALEEQDRLRVQLDRSQLHVRLLQNRLAGRAAGTIPGPADALGGVDDEHDSRRRQSARGSLGPAGPFEEGSSEEEAGDEDGYGESRYFLSEHQPGSSGRAVARTASRSAPLDDPGAPPAASHAPATTSPPAARADGSPHQGGAPANGDAGGAGGGGGRRGRRRTHLNSSIVFGTPEEVAESRERHRMARGGQVRSPDLPRDGTAMVESLLEYAERVREREVNRERAQGHRTHQQLYGWESAHVPQKSVSSSAPSESLSAPSQKQQDRPPRQPVPDDGPKWVAPFDNEADASGQLGVAAADLERRLLDLNLVRERLNTELRRMPAESAGRTATERNRKTELENELGRNQADIFRVRAEMRRLQARAEKATQRAAMSPH